MFPLPFLTSRGSNETSIWPIRRSEEWLDPWRFSPLVLPVPVYFRPPSPPNVLRSVAVLHMHQNICKVDSCARIRLTASGRQHLQNVEKHTSTRRKDSYTYGMQNGKIGMCQNIEQTCNHSGSWTVQLDILRKWTNPKVKPEVHPLPCVQAPLGLTAACLLYLSWETEVQYCETVPQPQAVGLHCRITGNSPGPWWKCLPHQCHTASVLQTDH